MCRLLIFGFVFGPFLYFLMLLPFGHANGYGSTLGYTFLTFLSGHWISPLKLLV
jgi:hypothetical protein